MITLFEIEVSGNHKVKNWALKPACKNRQINRFFFFISEPFVETTTFSGNLISFSSEKKDKSFLWKFTIVKEIQFQMEQSLQQIFWHDEEHDFLSDHAC